MKKLNKDRVRNTYLGKVERRLYHRWDIFFQWSTNIRGLLYKDGHDRGSLVYNWARKRMRR